MSALRLFAALEVPAAIRDALHTAVAPLRAGRAELRWTPPHQWHLTVAFVGHVDDQRVVDVAAALREAAATAPARIELALAGGGRFGRRVLWVGVDDRPEGSVTALGGAAQAALTDAGLPVDRKDVHPHLTLARAGGRGRVDRGLAGSVPEVDAAWAADELVLFASVPQGHGRPNRYEALERLPLGPPVA